MVVCRVFSFPKLSTTYKRLFLMKSTFHFIHLSDLHYRENWQEDQEIVLERFFEDLQKQLASIEKKSIFFVFSGDLVVAGEDYSLYTSFYNKFNVELDKLSIPKCQRIIVPGNHDVSQKHIKEKQYEHEAVCKENFDERRFNDYMATSKPSLIFDKFTNYLTFQKKFAQYGIDEDAITGKGWSISEKLGVYCLNTALLSSGGFNGINDKERLSIDTRSIIKWVTNCQSSIKVLIMHHPLEWLSEWSRNELKTIIDRYFSLCLTGHVHEQGLLHAINKNTSRVSCSAPPLLTNKFDDLGYSIITLSDENIEKISYRQWTKFRSFVSGVNFSDTDDGIVMVSGSSIFYSKEQNEFRHDVVEVELRSRLENSLRTFSGQPIIWVNRELSRAANPTQQRLPENLVTIEQILTNGQSSVIKAPPQFGLTCLGHFLAKSAWTTAKELWIFLDAKSITPYNFGNEIERQLDSFKLSKDRIKAIILDSWSELDKDSTKLLKKISNAYPQVRLIILQSVDESLLTELGQREKASENSDDDATEYGDLNREFTILSLLPLSRNDIRNTISQYNDYVHISDENIILQKLVSDLEVLNIHRTPLNCLTLLKVAEKYFDESPVNRSELIRLVLFLLFNSDGVPTYKVRPDMKDCEYVLGKFCESMLRKNNSMFSRESFLKNTRDYCQEQRLDLEVDLVFDILFENHIIVKKDNGFSFRFTYWIYYFAAQRMKQDPGFASYILEDMRYAAYPEIIEFYTGIDRNREDAIRILLSNLKETSNEVEKKVGLPMDFNPYSQMVWNPTPDSVSKLKKEIAEDVLSSKLPEIVKDRYADMTYDYSKPYNQSIGIIFKEYSLNTLWQNLRAASRALRNSDYINPELKNEILSEIMRAWQISSSVIFAIAPLLALNGRAVFDGVGFMLIGGFDEDPNVRFNQVLQNVGTNVVNWFKDDLFSPKMAPLIFEHFESSENDIIEHEIACMLIQERPNGWRYQIESYIEVLSKNSYYLFNVLVNLNLEYQYSYATKKELKDIEFLIKMTIAKHEFGTKKPGIEKIKKISDSVFPKREVDE